MTTDPFLELRIRDRAIDPDPEFRRALRERVEHSLAQTQGDPMNPTYIPASLHAMTPYLCCRNAREAITWYGDAFGSELVGETYPMSETDDRVGHAELRIGDSTFMLSDEWPEGDTFSPETRGGATTAFVLYVPDVDATYDRAVDLGATALRPVDDGQYGSRAGWLNDPFGHRWMIGTAYGPGGPLDPNTTTGV